MSRLLSQVALSAARHPWRTVVTFVVSLLLLGGAAGAVGAGYSDEVRLGDTDSQRASDLLAERFPAVAGDTATLVFHSDGTVRGDAGVEGVLATVATQPDVAQVTPLQVSPDGRTGYADVLYTKKAADLSVANLDRLEAAVQPLASSDVEASMRGPVVDRWRERPTPVGEVIGLVAAVVLVSLLFRSVVAMAVTVGSALLGLALGNTVLAVVSGFVDVPTVAPTIAIMLGLGAGVDYALFLVARFRARLRAGDDVVTAAARANSTTGSAVVTAGAIVVVSICGLYVTGITVIGRMGMAAAIVVAVAALTTVTLVPAVPPNDTVAPIRNPLPEMVTTVPPASGPSFGETLLTAGAGKRAYVKPPASVPVCVSGFVTTTATVPALLAGATAVICVGPPTWTLVAGVPPNVTVAPGAKFVPTMVTVVPPPVVPLSGVAEVTVGAAPAV